MKYLFFIFLLEVSLSANDKPQSNEEFMRQFIQLDKQVQESKAKTKEMKEKTALMEKGLEEKKEILYKQKQELAKLQRLEKVVDKLSKTLNVD